MTATPRPLRRYPTRAVAVTLLAIVLVLLGALGIWLLGVLIVTGAWPPEAGAAIHTIGGSRLDSPQALTAAIVFAVLGLVMLLAAFVPGTPSRIQILSDDVPGETVVPNRDLARRIRLAVEHLDGVQSTRVRVTSRRAEVNVRAVLDDAAPIRAASDQAVAELRPTAPMRIRTIK